MPRHLFRRYSRLTGPAQFQALLGSRLVAKSGRFVVQATRNQRPIARLGIVVAKRTVREAVHRNFLKRLIRETFRHHQRGLSGYDVLVRIRRDVERLESKAVQMELTRLFRAIVR